jgi:hypothetical protein
MLSKYSVARNCFICDGHGHWDVPTLYEPGDRLRLTITFLIHVRVGIFNRELEPVALGPTATAENQDSSSSLQFSKLDHFMDLW